MPENIFWTIKSFDSLSVYQLYSILRLRIDVFMIEQNCLYTECDGKDFKGKHLIGITDDEIVAYARLLPPGIAFKHPAIGRVVVTQSYRNKGVGRQLMARAIEELTSEYPSSPIEISAQIHLKSFYESLGFKQISDHEYMEDGIPHIDMLLT